MRTAIEQGCDIVQDVSEDWSKWVKDNVPVPVFRDPRESDADAGGAAAQGQGLFNDLSNLKHGTSEQEEVDQEARERAKYHDGFIGRLVTNKKFEAATIMVITLNALEIGWDTDYSARIGKPDNLYEGPLSFIICENAFAIYFTFEIIARALAYKRKITMLKDGWFIFDFFLVSFMVVETWILAFLGGSPLGGLSILRLLRLLRITRMAKLMRAVPELMMIVKGITAATRAVVWTFVLLFVITYTWAILLTNEYHQGLTPDDDVEEEAQQLFGSMGKSFSSLLVMGTILDDVTYATDVIRGTDNLPILVAFIIYIVINSFTMLNMLVGILCEVVASTKEGEDGRELERHIRNSITDLFGHLDRDASGGLSRKEFFMGLRNTKSLLKGLKALNISEEHFDKYGDIFFSTGDEDGAETSVDYETMIEVIMRLRPSESMNKLDFNAFRAGINGGSLTVSKRLDQTERQCDDLCNFFGLRNNKGSTENPAHPAPREGERTSPRLQLINPHMIAQLQATPYVDIVNEMQRRCGVENFDETGVPLELLDDDLRSLVCMHSDFLT